ncbi:MAG: nitrous oxide reductase family maturation protein NosD, partial [Deltaproteobacteria bacterium]|nr:nitrous oxide reductase family maturation protein NosD [Deltaproteobacteria bacterium]
MILKTIPLFSFLIVCLSVSPVIAGPVASLQVLIDQTPEGETVRLKPGIYAGPVIIEKAVILDGKGRVTIDGQGKGSVLLLKADGVVVKNMIITNSGDSHDQVDAGIL